MKYQTKTLNKHTDIAIIGTGMGSLTTACLLTNEGQEVALIEQNYLPGGCTSSYYRQGYIFESGATTVVGLDDKMPLHYLLQEIGLDFDYCQLNKPMQVHLKSGESLTRYQDLDQWIEEAEKTFGPKGQRQFWELCYKISQFVWETSLRQQSFPPSSWKDLGPMARGFRFKQLSFARWAFVSMDKLLKRFQLHDNAKFVDFVNEQLLITAQNFAEEVNVLFGATALCYTNFGNFYVYGGLIQMVNRICEWLAERGAKIYLRNAVKNISYKNGKYHILTEQGLIIANKVVSGVPINNLTDLWPDEKIKKKYASNMMDSSMLNSAFQMGIGFHRKGNTIPEVLHHQIHLDKPLPQIGSKSIFLSFSHPDDWYRAPLDKMVASISTHIPNPQSRPVTDQQALEEIILKLLDEKGLIRRDSVDYYHSSASASWERWTNRKHGFVGGYPQYINIKPWQMIDARIDGKGAYLCGDTAYPGQGIPGVCLSGIIAWRKMKLDGLIKHNKTQSD